MQELNDSVHHVVVTTGQLIPTLAKLLICGLDAHVPAECIYSARNETKAHCFRLIEGSFGPGATYCVIGEKDTAPRWRTSMIVVFVYQCDGMGWDHTLS